MKITNSIYLFQYQCINTKKNKIEDIVHSLKKNFLFPENFLKKKFITIKKKIFLNKSNKKNFLYILQNQLLQKNFYKNKKKKILNKKDNSFSIHQCYSRLQEVQQLYKHIINIFNVDKTIKPKNILITANNLEPYIPYIQKTFHLSYNNKNFIYQNKDIQKKKILSTLQNIFKIKNNRFKYIWVLSLLDTKFLRKKFFIKSKQIKTLYTLLSDLHVRYGFDKNHFKKMSLPNIYSCSWVYAINRITSGFWLNKKYSIWNNISIYNVSSEKVNILLGNFIHFISELNKLRKSIINKKLLKNWIKILPRVINIFFKIPNQYKKFFFMLENIWKKIILNGIQMNYKKKISIEFLLERFFKFNFLKITDNQFMSGGINVINFNQVKSIPFDIIGIMGCTQKNFSRTKKKDILSIINTEKDNKNVFFETIMSSKKYLFCSYIKKNSIQNKTYPSIWIQDILSYAKKNFFSYKNLFFQKKKKK